MGRLKIKIKDLENFSMDGVLEQVKKRKEMSKNSKKKEGNKNEKS